MNMQSSKVEVLWSPNKEDEFATYGTELKLYRYQVRTNCVILSSLLSLFTSKQKSASNSGPQKAPGSAGVGRPDLSLDKDYCGQRIGILKSDINTIPVYQSVAWQQNESKPNYFAIGQNSGKTVLAK